MKSKTLNRIGFISSNALRQVFVSAVGIVIPFLVIHFLSREVWGEFVPILLYTLFAVQIINWGNKEYLLRQFSVDPAKMKIYFSSILTTRLPLLFLFSLICLWLYPTANGFYVFLWLLGRYLSHAVEPVLFFEKKFNTFLLIEISCFLLFCSAVFFVGQNDAASSLLLIYSGYQLAKGVFSLLIFKSFISADHLKFDFTFYKKAFPFLLLSVFGFLTSKSDVYLVQFFCDKWTTANYQIINGLLVFIITISVFIYTPFTKNIYRNNDEVIKKYQKTLSLSGLVIVPVALFICHFIIVFYLKLQLSFWFYLLAFIYIYPSYIYGIQIVNKFKAHKEQLVILYLFCSAAANAVFSALFLYLGYGILGALLGGCLSQLIALYLFCFKKDKKPI